MPTPRASDDIGSLTVLTPDQVAADAPRRRLPSWLKRPIPASRGTYFTQDLIAELGLETICESGKCPNRSECWTRRTATFMVLGETCTRPCGFCAVKRGKPEAVALDEPDRLAEACARLGLKHVVITSVTRDDLPDGGADHFRRCILAVRERTGATIEVLTPDFDGDTAAIDIVLAGEPEVFNHNLETVARLQQYVRRKSQYAVSLAVLEHAKKSLTEGQDQERPDARPGRDDRRSPGDAGRSPVHRGRLPDAGAIPPTLAEHLPVDRYLPPRSSTNSAGWPERWASSKWPARRSCGRAITPTRWRLMPRNDD